MIRRGRPPLDARALAMKRLYDRGRSLRQIAEYFDTVPSAVLRMFARRGWPRRPAVNPRKRPA
jgi:hypothetical protein